MLRGMLQNSMLDISIVCIAVLVSSVLQNVVGSRVLSSLSEKKRAPLNESKKFQLQATIVSVFHSSFAAICSSILLIQIETTTEDGAPVVT